MKTEIKFPKQTAEEKEKDVKVWKEWRQEQRKREEWRKSEHEKAERMADRYTGGQAGVERWLISHL